MNAQEFQAHAEKMFPVVPHLGLQVVELNSDRCRLSGSAEKNRNHIGTVFGGSLYSFAALSCYGWIFAKLDDSGITTHNIVISEGSIDYKYPVLGDFEARCDAPDALHTETFIASVAKKSRGRLPLKAQIYCEGKVCAEFTGFYVAKT